MIQFKWQHYNLRRIFKKLRIFNNYSTGSKSFTNNLFLSYPPLFHQVLSYELLLITLMLVLQSILLPTGQG